MDTLTQGLLGAAAAQLVLGRRLGHRAWIAGMAGGLLPDADMLLQPLADPALPWSLHRHFTHGIVMAPVMGALAVLPLLLWGAMRRDVRLVGFASILGALTHAPLDWCTSYGTKILWPFSFENFTLDLFPIVDPLFTLALVVGVIAAARRRRLWPAMATWAFIALYTGVAFFQQAAAAEAQARLIERRGHPATHARVMPLPGSLLVWRSLYEAEGGLHADVVRAMPGAELTFLSGGSRPRLDPIAVLAATPPESRARVRSVLERFTVFADGYVARVQGDAALLGDMRFTSTPGFDPIWGLRLQPPGAVDPVTWSRPALPYAERAEALVELILGTAPGLRPLPAPR